LATDYVYFGCQQMDDVTQMVAGMIGGIAPGDQLKMPYFAGPYSSDEVAHPAFV
jgi:hypothetical protein